MGGVTEATDRWGLDSLDGLKNTLISHRIDDLDVMIGGGPDGFILTAQTTDLTRIVTALSGTAEGDADDEETVDMTVGGQSVDYPSYYVLDKSEVLRALDDIIGGNLPTERWEIVEG
jgi:hypothetical protein